VWWGLRSAVVLALPPRIRAQNHAGTRSVLSDTCKARRRFSEAAKSRYIAKASTHGLSLYVDWETVI